MIVGTLEEAEFNRVVSGPNGNEVWLKAVCRQELESWTEHRAGAQASRWPIPSSTLHHIGHVPRGQLSY